MMNLNCKRCGAALVEGNRYCTQCGAPRSEQAAPVAAGHFCTSCGAALGTATKFCTKCGATAGTTASEIGRASANVPVRSSSSAAAGAAPPAVASAGPVVRSDSRIPKAVIAGIVVVLVLIVAAGSISALRRARQKAAGAKAAKEFEKGISALGSKANTATQTTNAQTPSDINKTLSDFTAAANKLSQDAQKLGNANPQNVIAGAADPASTSAPGSGSPPDSAAAIATASAAANAALVPPPIPAGPPMASVAGTGDPAHDWPLQYERTVGGPEADLVVRTGDINNLGFGWPKGFDPFSGQSTPVHPWPSIDKIPPNAPPGTDRIMVGSSVMPVHMSIKRVAGQADRIAVDRLVKQRLPGDGYSGALGDCFLVMDFEAQLEDPHAPKIIASDEEGEREMTRFWAPKCTRGRELTMPTPIVLDVGELPSKINEVVVQIFADDFQAASVHSHFQLSLNGTRIPAFEYAINSLDQSGPVGKLLTLRLLPEYWPLLKSGTVKLLIDDPMTRAPDGYAVDFVRILVNPHNFKYQVSLAATVKDADTHKPITGATVNAGLESAATDRQGKCELKGIPAGLVVATANAPGYDENSVPVDLPSGQSGNAEIDLRRHQESTAALEQAIAQTGTATIYGIHFDTDSSKIRGDSIPALNAVLGLINNHPGSQWSIAGHTDNVGDAPHNQTLSEARANSVVAWLKAHGVTENHLAPQGFGATRPIADNATANGRALNRRVEVALEK